METNAGRELCQEVDDMDNMDMVDGVEGDRTNGTDGTNGLRKDAEAFTMDDRTNGMRRGLDSTRRHWLHCRPTR